MGLINELSMNPGPFACFGAYADEPGCPGTSRVRCPSWSMKPLYSSCWRGLHPQAVAVSPPVCPLESLSSRNAGCWWLLFHLGLPVGGGGIASRGLHCILKEEGGVGTTVEGQLCIVCGGVPLESGRGKGSSTWRGKRSHGFRISGFCFLLIREIWAQQGYEEEALRV